MTRDFLLVLRLQVVVTVTVLTWFLSGDVSKHVDDAGVVAEAETVIQQQRNVQRCETFISDVLPFCFTDRHQRFVVRLHSQTLLHTVAQKIAAALFLFRM